MAYRAMLHKTKLTQFRDWLVSEGHVLLPAKGDYEVLRWRGVPGRAMPIVFDRHGAKEHFTCNDAARPYVQAWLTRDLPDE